MLAPAVGTLEAARAVDHFLGCWSYGVGLVGHRAVVLAGLLEGAASAFEVVEARLVVEAGGVAPVVALPSSGFVVPPPLQWAVGSRWGLLPWQGMAVTLSGATHPGQLVPGEPADVETLAAALRSFAADATRGAVSLARLSVGGWVGQAAEVFAAELGGLPAQLEGAAAAFAEASDGPYPLEWTQGLVAPNIRE